MMGLRGSLAAGSLAIPLRRSLLSLTKQLHRGGGSIQRHLSTSLAPHESAKALAYAPEVKFEDKKFENEDLKEIAKEVPDLKYYILEDTPAKNPYRKIPLDNPIWTESELGIPSFKELPQPKMRYTKLENGVKIASIDKHGPVSSIGMFVHAGSRFEDASNFGVSHLIELMAFTSTANLSHLRTIKTIEALGAEASCTAGREHMVYQTECLRESMPIMVPLLIGNTLYPRFLKWEIEDKKNDVEKATKKLEKKPESLLTELMHHTAYHNNTLGNKLHATDTSLTYFDGDTLRNFMMNHFSADRTVLAAVNVDHDEFCKWVMRAYVEYQSIPSSPREEKKPVYTGGSQRVEAPLPVCHTTIGFPTGGWYSSDLEAVTVLQMLLGGGGSFSTGGPGKGIHSRLYREVLNRHGWVESCLAFNSIYSDSGLFGLYFVSDPARGPELVSTMIHQLKRMANVTPEELNRAKNSLISSIWMNLENRSVVMEDVARQLLMGNKVVGGEEFCKSISEVTAEDVKRVAEKMLQEKPTIVAYGNTFSLPHYDEICELLRQKS